MKNPIIIFGSSRPKGSTWSAICELNHDRDIPVIDLNTLNITSYDYENKNRDDDYLPLMEKVLKHNPIILATPVYWYSMSAQMKIFIDRLTDCISIRKDIGKSLKGKTLYVLASYSTNLPEGFELPFSQTCTYMSMYYGGCFFYYAGGDRELLKGNDKIKGFYKL